MLFYFENLHLSILKKVVHRQYPILIISVSGCNYPWVFSPSSDMIHTLASLSVDTENRHDARVKLS